MELLLDIHAVVNMTARSYWHCNVTIFSPYIKAWAMSITVPSWTVCETLGVAIKHVIYQNTKH